MKSLMQHKQASHSSHQQWHSNAIALTTQMNATGIVASLDSVAASTSSSSSRISSSPPRTNIATAATLSNHHVSTLSTSPVRTQVNGDSVTARVPQTHREILQHALQTIESAITTLKQNVNQSAHSSTNGAHHNTSLAPPATVAAALTTKLTKVNGTNTQTTRTTTKSRSRSPPKSTSTAKSSSKSPTRPAPSQLKAKPRAKQQTAKKSPPSQSRTASSSKSSTQRAPSQQYQHLYQTQMPPPTQYNRLFAHSSAAAAAAADFYQPPPLPVMPLQHQPQQQISYDQMHRPYIASPYQLLSHGYCDALPRPLESSFISSPYSLHTQHASLQPSFAHLFHQTHSRSSSNASTPPPEHDSSASGSRPSSAAESVASFSRMLELQRRRLENLDAGSEDEAAAAERSAQQAQRSTYSLTPVRALPLSHTRANGVISPLPAPPKHTSAPPLPHHAYIAPTVAALSQRRLQDEAEEREEREQHERTIARLKMALKDSTQHARTVSPLRHSTSRRQDSDILLHSDDEKDRLLAALHRSNSHFTPVSDVASSRNLADEFDARIRTLLAPPSSTVSASASTPLPSRSMTDHPPMIDYARAYHSMHERSSALSRTVPAVNGVAAHHPSAFRSPIPTSLPPPTSAVILPPTTTSASSAYQQSIESARHLMESYLSAEKRLVEVINSTSPNRKPMNSTTTTTATVNVSASNTTSVARSSLSEENIYRMREKSWIASKQRGENANVPIESVVASTTDIDIQQPSASMKNHREEEEEKQQDESIPLKVDDQVHRKAKEAPANEVPPMDPVEVLESNVVVAHSIESSTLTSTALGSTITPPPLHSLTPSSRHSSSSDPFTTAGESDREYDYYESHDKEALSLTPPPVSSSPPPEREEEDDEQQRKEMYVQHSSAEPSSLQSRRSSASEIPSFDADSTPHRSNSASPPTANSHLRNELVSSVKPLQTHEIITSPTTHARYSSVLKELNEVMTSPAKVAVNDHVADAKMEALNVQIGAEEENEPQDVIEEAPHGLISQSPPPRMPSPDAVDLEESVEVELESALDTQPIVEQQLISETTSSITTTTVTTTTSTQLTTQVEFEFPAESLASEKKDAIAPKIAPVEESTTKAENELFVEQEILEEAPASIESDENASSSIVHDQLDQPLAADDTPTTQTPPCGELHAMTAAAASTSIDSTPAGYYAEDGTWISSTEVGANTTTASADISVSSAYYDETTGQFYDPVSNSVWNEEIQSWVSCGDAATTVPVNTSSDLTETAQQQSQSEIDASAQLYDNEKSFIVDASPNDSMSVNPSHSPLELTTNSMLDELQPMPSLTTSTVSDTPVDEIEEEEEVIVEEKPKSLEVSYEKIDDDHSFPSQKTLTTELTPSPQAIPPTDSPSDEDTNDALLEQQKRSQLAKEAEDEVLPEDEIEDEYVTDDDEFVNLKPTQQDPRTKKESLVDAITFALLQDITRDSLAAFNATKQQEPTKMNGHGNNHAVEDEQPIVDMHATLPLKTKKKNASRHSKSTYSTELDSDLDDISLLSDHDTLHSTTNTLTATMTNILGGTLSEFHINLADVDVLNETGGKSAVSSARSDGSIAIPEPLSDRSTSSKATAASNLPLLNTNLSPTLTMSMPPVIMKDNMSPRSTSQSPALTPSSRSPLPTHSRSSSVPSLTSLEPSAIDAIVQSSVSASTTPPRSLTPSSHTSPNLSPRAAVSPYAKELLGRARLADLVAERSHVLGAMPKSFIVEETKGLQQSNRSRGSSPSSLSPVGSPRMAYSSRLSGASGSTSGSTSSGGSGQHSPVLAMALNQSQTAHLYEPLPPPSLVNPPSHHPSPLHPPIPAHPASSSFSVVQPVPKMLPPTFMSSSSSSTTPPLSLTSPRTSPTLRTRGVQLTPPSFDSAATAESVVLTLTDVMLTESAASVMKIREKRIEKYGVEQARLFQTSSLQQPSLSAQDDYDYSDSHDADGLSISQPDVSSMTPDPETYEISHEDLAGGGEKTKEEAQQPYVMTISKPEEEEEDEYDYDDVGDPFDEYAALDDAPTLASATAAAVAKSNAARAAGLKPSDLPILLAEPVVLPQIISSDAWVKKYLREILLFQAESTSTAEPLSPSSSSLKSQVEAGGGHWIQKIDEKIFTQIEETKAYFQKREGDDPTLPRSFEPISPTVPFPLVAQSSFHRLLFDSLNERIEAYQQYWVKQRREPWFKHLRVLGTVLETATATRRERVDDGVESDDDDDDDDESDISSDDTSSSAADMPRIRTHMKQVPLENGIALMHHVVIPSRHDETLTQLHERMVARVLHETQRMHQVTRSTPTLRVALATAASHVSALTAGPVNAPPAAPAPNVKVPTTSQSVVEYEMRMVDAALGKVKKGHHHHPHPHHAALSPHVMRHISRPSSPLDSLLDLSCDSQFEWEQLESRESIALVADISEAILTDLMISTADLLQSAQKKKGTSSFVAQHSRRDAHPKRQIDHHGEDASNSQAANKIGRRSPIKF